MGERILKEGYLIKAPDGSKHLHNSKRWQRKWCTLDESGDLNYYESDKRGRPTGILHVCQCLQIFDPQSKGVQLHYSLGLRFPDYASYFKMESAHSFNEWLSLLRDFAENCDVEEIPVSEERRGTTSSSHFSMRGGSVSSLQSRNLSISIKSRFQHKEGVMAKTGSNNKGWKDRYFVLTHGRLSYYKNEKSVQSGDSPLGTVDLFECSSVAKTTGKKGYGFDLHLPSRVFNFSTESEVDQVGWTSAIHHALGIISDIKGASLGSSGTTLNVVRSGSVSSNMSGSSLEKILENNSNSSQEGGKEEIEARVGKQEDKDGVVQLLEAEVEVLRSKVSSLEADLRSSSTVNGQLQDQLVEERREKNITIKELRQNVANKSSQIEQLEKTKQDLETVNDSVQAQLEEQQDKTLILEEEQANLRQDLEEAHNVNSTVEEELADTQTKLQEIEEMATKLEEALKKRGNSEPPSSDLTNLRSLNLSYKAKMEGEEGEEGPRSLDVPSATPSVPTDEDPIGNAAFLEVEKLKVKLRKVEKERDAALQHVSLPPHPAPLEDSHVSDTTERMVHEERLKWQVEVVNIRRELDGKLEKERSVWEEERASLKQEVSRLKGELKSSKTYTQQQVEQLQAKLERTGQRIEQLEGELSSASERVGQLLVEKEKALADLKTIRKTNKSIEKRMSETEGLRRAATPTNTPTPTSIATPTRSSVSSMNSSNGDKSPVLTEDGAEVIISDLKSQLTSVEKERDHLRVQLEKLISSQASEKSRSSSVPSPPFPFLLHKSQATVGTSGRSVGGQSQAPPTTSLWNGLVISSTDPPPPKPKKPSKELLDQYTISSSPPLKRQPLSFDDGIKDQPPSIRTRTMSVIQTLFAAHR